MLTYVLSPVKMIPKSEAGDPEGRYRAKRLLVLGLYDFGYDEGLGSMTSHASVPSAERWRSKGLHDHHPRIVHHRHRHLHRILLARHLQG